MKRKIYLTATIALFGLFFLFTALVMTVDVQPIGPNGTTVGLASINGAFRDALGTTESYNELWRDVSALGACHFCIPFWEFGVKVCTFCIP